VPPPSAGARAYESRPTLAAARDQNMVIDALLRDARRRARRHAVHPGARSGDRGVPSRNDHGGFSRGPSSSGPRARRS
jgi:hypothetical protein